MLWTDWAPVDVTLTTPGTAQSLYTIAPKIPAVNLITNPSMETGTPPTGFTLSGSTLAQSATVARSGTNSLRITPDNAAAGEGAYWTTQSLAGAGPDREVFLVASGYFNDNAGSGNGVRVIIANTSGVALATGNTVTLAANWTGRSTAAFRLTGVTAAQYRIYFVTATQFATVFYVDDVQVELLEQNTATDYCDGAQGIDYEWEGTAHASRSRRHRGIVAVRGYNLYTTRNVYISYDQTASTTTGRRVLAGTDFWNDHPMNIKNRISIINELSGEQPRVFGEVLGVHFGRM
ncbi:hypothetical protein HYS94_02220 [Candidatus Daviesbacteria bacterium]|nr:hypothetical protein [Candidatus Daviesbacteria bacterium]